VTECTKFFGRLSKSNILENDGIKMAAAERDNLLMNENCYGATQRMRFMQMNLHPLPVSSLNI